MRTCQQKANFRSKEIKSHTIQLITKDFKHVYTDRDADGLEVPYMKEELIHEEGI